MSQSILTSTQVAELLKSSAIARSFLLKLAGILVAILCPFMTMLHGQWVQQGASPSKGGQVEGIADKEVTGAIKCLAAHPRNANIIYIGAVNGGIWRSGNAKAAVPIWSYLSADLPGQSIGALEFDPLDTSFNTLVAGIGRFSSFYNHGAGGFGVFKTTSGGSRWFNLDNAGTFKNISITGIAARGSIILVSSAAGVFRTADNGISWRLISGDPASGLPAGAAFDLTGDPSNNNTFYTHAGDAGTFKSMDRGSSWVKINDQHMDQSLSQVTNLKFAVGNNDNVFVGIVSRGQLRNLFRSSNGGAQWVEMDIPATQEISTSFGIHSGHQGNIHFSLAADPNNHSIVYIGGDRQPAGNEPDQRPRFPNSLGARDYSGRLFRVNAAEVRGRQCTPLTHSGTMNNSAPHADSRDMCFDSEGNLLEADDGGIYKRTNPVTNLGDWFSLNSNLNLTEVHSVDWDANADIIISGVQDNGTPQQEAPLNHKWLSFRTGDGGDVCVDDISSDSVSYRYSSFHELMGFVRSRWSAANTILDQVYPQLYDVTINRSILGFGFVAPIKMNSVVGSRLLIASTNGLYESFDQGNTVRRIASFSVNEGGRDVLAYGAADNSHIVYAGVNGTVRVRKEAAPVGFTVSSRYTGNEVEGISIDPDHCGTAFVIDATNVFYSADTAKTWIDITGNLQSFRPGILRSVVYISMRTNADRLAVGTDVGVFVATAPNFNQWTRLGNSFPNVSVFDLEFDRKDNILVAGTMGMGTWTFQF